MALDEWVVASRRRLVLFVGVLFVVPAVLLLSGRIIGVGGLAARNPGQLWVSLLACVLIALPCGRA